MIEAQIEKCREQAALYSKPVPHEDAAVLVRVAAYWGFFGAKAAEWWGQRVTHRTPSRLLFPLLAVEGACQTLRHLSFPSYTNWQLANEYRAIEQMFREAYPEVDERLLGEKRRDAGDDRD